METNDKTNSVAPDPSASRPRPTMLHRLIHNMPLVVLVVLASVVVMLFGMIRSEGKEIDARKAAEKGTHRPATNVVAMEITPQRLKEHISLPGQAKPWLSLTVVAEVPGKIVEKAVAQGARVDQGDVLARIDARDYANAYASATASYEVAVSNQKRLKALFDDRVATQAQIDDIQAVVRTSKAAMDNAALDLERCTIRAPMAGVVNQIPVEPGQYMDVSKAVAQILNIDRVKIEVGIPESDVDAVRRLEQFTITVDALGGRTFQGKRHYLSKTTDNFARLYNLEIVVPNPDHTLLPDMFVRVNVVKHEVADGLAVPLYAVVRHLDVQGVYVVEDDTARLRPVKLGFQDGWQMQVTSGLARGDRVVVVGQRSIDDAAPVNLVRTVTTMAELAQ